MDKQKINDGEKPKFEIIVLNLAEENWNKEFISLLHK